MVVVVVVVVVNSPSSANRFRWKSFWDSTEEDKSSESKAFKTTQKYLTDARVQPKQSLPAQTIVQLLQIRPLAGTVCPQWSAQYAQHGLSAPASLAGALFRDAVHGAGLFENLQPRPAVLVLAAHLRHGVTRRRWTVHDSVGGGRHETLRGTLRTGRVELLLGDHAAVVAVRRFPVGKERFTLNSINLEDC